ncbi:MAG: bifunctional riboflavin kinase/FAD synthetase [Cytophagaceae bacterium]|nr:bifunctional riboflavin kinase/FAD synthetase [Cytophagaceae bacterium]
MKTWKGIELFKPLRNAVVTSGIFDGVHKGHQKILTSLVESAKDINGESVVLTFWPHPRKVLNPSSSIEILTTLEEKSNLIASLNVDHLIIIAFTKEFSALSSYDFLKKILEQKIGTKKLLIGYDHKFGKNREGSFEYIQKNAFEFGFEVDEIPRQDVHEIAVSSTTIRNALKEGNIQKATEYLGRNYSFTGKVVKGKQLGTQLGFPTANLQLEDNKKLIPKDGIYAVRTVFESQTYNGMMSIGFNPTVGGNARTIEVNIFDFDKFIYEKNLEVHLVEYLREEKKFQSLNELIYQIKEDKKKSLKILT